MKSYLYLALSLSLLSSIAFAESPADYHQRSLAACITKDQSSINKAVCGCMDQFEIAQGLNSDADIEAYDKTPTGDAALQTALNDCANAATAKANDVPRQNQQ